MLALILSKLLKNLNRDIFIENLQYTEAFQNTKKAKIKKKTEWHFKICPGQVLDNWIWFHLVYQFSESIQVDIFNVIINLAHL